MLRVFSIKKIVCSKIWGIIVLSLFAFQSSEATVANYTFAQSGGNYTALSGATTLYSGSWDDGSSALLTIPFTFVYNGTSYTSLGVNANGFITMGATNTDVYCGVQQSAVNSIAGYGTDLVGASATSSISYATRGSSPNRQFVIQWSDCDHYNNANQNHWTFQIVLNETSNTVQVVWGTSTVATTLGANSCTDVASESGNIGLLGATTTDYNIRSVTNGTHTWTTSVAGAALSAVCNMSPTNIPAFGTTYTWTPGASVAMVFSSATTGFINASQAIAQGFVGNQILKIQVVTSGTSSPFTVSSLTFSTTGCTNATNDILNAKIYFTGNNSAFSTATQFGTTVTGPNGSHSVSGSVALSEGTNYFWLTYDIKSAAIVNDIISGCCTQIVGSGTMGTRTPTVTCPAGTQSIATTGTWTPVASTAPNSNGGVMLVLSDGTVICKTSAGGSGYGNIWNKLTPNGQGSYVNGTWTSIAPMNHTRLYFSSQILKDGRVYVAGGEYGTGLQQVEVYDPLTNVWTMAPSPGVNISDANSAILEDGRVLQALVAGNLRINNIYDPVTNTFSAGPTCIGIHNESSWVKLQDNSILFIDRNATTSERYIPATNTWVADGAVPASLYDPYGLEFGTALLLPDGRAFFVGSTGKTAYYTPTGTTSPGTWTLGPDVPGAKGQPDAPGAMMVDGKILITVSPVPTSQDHFPPPTTFYEFNYLTNIYTQIMAPGGTTSLNISCYVTNLTDLPDGKVLYSRQGSNQYYVYTPNGSPLAAGKPTISNVIANGCNAYTITGTKFNGISEGACYGDDWQMATNYPIIRLTSGANVYYVRTFNWNSTGVRRGNLPDTTQFTIPATVPAGNYSLVVTANGIASDPVAFTVSSTASLSSSLTPGAICSGSAFTYTPTSNFSSATFTWTRAAVAGISNAAITVPQTSNPNEVLLNTTAGSLNVVYLYSIIANGCTVNTQSVTVVVNPKSPVITNASIAASQCANSALNIPFTTSCSFNAGNIFTAQLSNSVGSFASPTNIGTLTATGSGTINAFIPAGTATGAGYRIRIVSSNPINTGNDNGSNISIGSCAFNFLVKVFIQGYYSGSGTMRAAVDPIAYPGLCDTVKIELHNITTPFALVDVSTSTLNLSGNGVFAFSGATVGQQYYLVVKHRNALETWSANPVTMAANGSYNFTSTLSKAYGNNMVNVGPGAFAIWSGDVHNGVIQGTQDGIINDSDFNLEQSTLSSFLSGYNYKDLTGDRLVESADYSLIENNVKLFISVIKP